MNARFIGNTSMGMGFVKGKIYSLYSDVQVIGNKLCICLYDKNSRAWCPYANIDKILDNWMIFQ